MTVLALKHAAHCNGVAEIHGRVSREMWQHIYSASDPADVPIGHVTNGVHALTWLAPQMRAFYRKHLKADLEQATPESNWWKRADKLDPAALWEMRGKLRARLVNFIRRRLAEQVARRVGPLEDLTAVIDTFDEETLTIGFARRFATYKRAPLIFSDVKRVANLLNDPKRPVQIVFAGKAHPKDAAGQAFAKKIYGMAHKAGFRGRVAILENYDMHIGRMLTSGCDVWLNNPLMPMEASGTSGMKPPLHGGLNCSIPDGWWPEGYDGKNGWMVGGGEQFKSQARQDKHDASALYTVLEEEIVPLFYRRDREGLPQKWLAMCKDALASIPVMFNTTRMVGEYVDKYYLPAHAARRG
jgi:starch phosphorylase